VTETRAEKMRAAIKSAAEQLARVRRCSERDALFAVMTTYRQNLHDSFATSDESYWRAMLAIAEELAGSTA
jgi:hypothetical protein